MKKLRTFVLGAGTGIILSVATYFTLLLYLYMHFNYAFPSVLPEPAMTLGGIPLVILSLYSVILWASVRKIPIVKHYLEQKIFYYGGVWGYLAVVMTIWIWVVTR